MRKLGIPTVTDRVIQQAIVQVIQPLFEPNFSEHSYGFRPGRCCQDAVKELVGYLNDGYIYFVDIDLEKFFDNVNHDKLMSLVNLTIKDGQLESLISKYLKADIMERKERKKNDLGTPQGGNISPLLSNVMLNELDKELERRGHKFVRYADDCIIAVKSEASAKRTMESITNFIEGKLLLKVNREKSAVRDPRDVKYLGFGFYYKKKTEEWRVIAHKDSIGRLA